MWRVSSNAHIVVSNHGPSSEPAHLRLPLQRHVCGNRIQVCPRETPSCQRGIQHSPDTSTERTVRKEAGMRDGAL